MELKLNPVEKTPYSEDERIEKIMNLIVRFSTLDFSTREKISEKGDEIDAIIAGLNTLGEELATTERGSKEYERRVNNLMEVLLKFTMMDFSQKAEVSERADEVDAIAVGLNTLAEELDALRENEKEFIAQLKENEEKFNKAFRASPAGITITRLSDSAYIDVNDAFLQMTGFKKEELIGHSSAQAGLIVNIPERETVVTQIREKGAIRNFEMSVQSKSGKRVDVLSSVETIELNGEKCAINIIYDITERKRVENKLKESEERFRLMVNSVKDYSIIMLDPDGKISSWNKGAERMNGYKAEEVIGKDVSIFYTDKDKAEGIPAFNLEQAKAKGSFETEGWRKRKDGSLFFADITYTALFDEKEVLKGFSKVVRDITEKREAEEHLRSVNQFLETILNNIPNMIFVKDAKELKFLRFNKAGQKLLGHSDKDLLGKNDYDFFPKEQADFFTSKDKEVIQGKEIVDIPEEPINTPSGEKWLHTQKIPVENEKGEPLYLIGISEDITKRKENEDRIERLYKEREKYLAELEVANKELEAFSYSVSHDLRAPLRAIHSYTKILSEEYLAKAEDEAKQMMNSVINNARKMGQLIDDLLTFSRTGRKEIQVVDIDMNKLVTSVLEDLKNNLPQFNAEIIKHPLPNAKGDSALIAQVLVNLLSNAIKFSRTKEKPVIEIGSKQEDDKTIYFIKDNGVGFDMQYYDKLFGVFQRLHDMTEFEGTGVGLALVKRIITRHGGKVWAVSKLNEGTTFYFTLNHLKKIEQKPD